MIKALKRSSLYKCTLGMVTADEREAFCWRSSKALGFGFHCFWQNWVYPRSVLYQRL